MGFDICPKTNPEYTTKVNMWNWYRLLVLILWGEGVYDLDTLKSKFTSVMMLENDVKAMMAGESPAEFDLEEHRKKIEIRWNDSETETRTTLMEIHDVVDENTGKRTFIGASVCLPEEVKKDFNADTILPSIAGSIRVFQLLEDMMWAVRDTLPYYGMQMNGHELEPETCKRLLELILSILMPEEAMDLFRQASDIVAPDGPMCKMQYQSGLHEVFKEDIAEEYVTGELMSEFPILIGILTDSAAEGGAIIT